MGPLRKKQTNCCVPTTDVCMLQPNSKFPLSPVQPHLLHCDNTHDKDINFEGLSFSRLKVDLLWLYKCGWCVSARIYPEVDPICDTCRHAPLPHSFINYGHIFFENHSANKVCIHLPFPMNHYNKQDT